MIRVFETCRIFAAAAALLLLLAACQTSGQEPVAEHAIQLPASVSENEENRRAAAQRYLDTFELKELYARMAARKARVAKMPGRFSAQAGGLYDTRTPPDAWTKFAHALFQSNEAMFYH